jgi:hypothetical protein
LYGEKYGSHQGAFIGVDWDVHPVPWVDNLVVWFYTWEDCGDVPVFSCVFWS